MQFKIQEHPSSYYLKSFKVINFRNLLGQDLFFSKRVNCIFGDNGNGKTNLLEAIYYLICHKSFRKNVTFPQLLSTDCSKSEILLQSVFTSMDASEDLASLFTYSGRVFAKESFWTKDNVLMKKKLPLEVTFIGPFDAQLFFTEISFRRQLLDRLMASLEPSYRKELSSYQKLLQHRNKLLNIKPIQYKEQIFSLDEILSEKIIFIERMRSDFLKSLTPFFEKSFEALFDEKYKLDFLFVSTFKEMRREEILLSLKKGLEKDELSGMSLLGPHRDDFIPSVDALRSTEYCSLGQQKMLYLSLIFAYIDIFMYKSRTYPIVLIDDVSGELDQLRWRRFVTYLESKKFQVLITTANWHFAQELQNISDAYKMRVDAGQVLAL